MDEKHTLAAVGAAAVLGLMQGQGMSLPHFTAVGVPATYGVAAWALGRYSKNRTVQHVATGLLAVAAYDLARTSWAGPGSTATTLPPSTTATRGAEILHGEVLGGEL